MAAEAGPGKTVAVVGDDAVRLLAVLADRQLGAEQIHRHEPARGGQRLVPIHGAMEIVEERGDAGGARSRS